MGVSGLAGWLEAVSHVAEAEIHYGMEFGEGGVVGGAELVLGSLWVLLLDKVLEHDVEGSVSDKCGHGVRLC